MFLHTLKKKLGGKKQGKQATTTVGSNESCMVRKLVLVLLLEGEQSLQ